MLKLLRVGCVDERATTEADVHREDALSGGERLQKEIEAEAEAEGISKATLKRAATIELDAKRKNGIDGPWAWRLN